MLISLHGLLSTVRGLQKNQECNGFAGVTSNAGRLRPSNGSHAMPRHGTIPAEIGSTEIHLMAIPLKK